VDIRIIAEALGHDSLESTRIYTQVSFERVRQIAELFDLPRGSNKTPPKRQSRQGLARA
jgi:site-specific recombinase XerC